MIVIFLGYAEGCWRQFLDAAVAGKTSPPTASWFLASQKSQDSFTFKVLFYVLPLPPEIVFGASASRHHQISRINSGSAALLRLGSKQMSTA
jgi:hypothetical protein